MERLLDLLYNDLPMSSMAVQFGLIGVLAAAAGVLWHTIVRATPVRRELRPIPFHRR